MCLSAVSTLGGLSRYLLKTKTIQIWKGQYCYNVVPNINIDNTHIHLYYIPNV